MHKIRGVDPGGGGGGANISFFRQLEKFILCNAIMGLKSTAMHYRAIKFNIKILLNKHYFKIYIATLRAVRAENVEIVLTSPPPPPPIQYVDRRPYIVHIFHPHTVNYIQGFQKFNRRIVQRFYF